MASMNRAAAIRRCLDRLDSLEDALFDVEASIGSVEDLREALNERFKGKEVPAPEEVDALEAVFDLLEDRLNEALKEEESSARLPFRNPRRRR